MCAVILYISHSYGSCHILLYYCFSVFYIQQTDMNFIKLTGKEQRNILMQQLWLSKQNIITYINCM